MHSSLIHLSESSEQPVREGGVVIPILQMWSLRHGEVSWLAGLLVRFQPRSFCVTSPVGSWQGGDKANARAFLFVGVSGNVWSHSQPSQQRIWGQVRNKGSACPPHSNATRHGFSGVLGASKHPVIRKLPTPAAWTSTVARQGPASCSRPLEPGWIPQTPDLDALAVNGSTRPLPCVYRAYWICSQKLNIQISWACSSCPGISSLLYTPNL